MQITVELPDEVAQRLTARARARGMDLAAYAESMLETAAKTEDLTPPQGPRTRQQIEAFFKVMAEHSEKIPQLPDEAFTRESFYEDSY
jgi:hypothetical protein